MPTAAALAAMLARESAKLDVRAAIVVRRAAIAIQADAQAMAPVDTGFLKSSITTTVEPDGLSADIGPEADYGRHVEEGTYRMAAQPYLVPALERQADGFVQAMEQIGDV